MGNVFYIKQRKDNTIEYIQPEEGICPQREPLPAGNVTLPDDAEALLNFAFDHDFVVSVKTVINSMATLIKGTEASIDLHLEDALLGSVWVDVSSKCLSFDDLDLFSNAISCSHTVDIGNFENGDTCIEFCFLDLSHYPGRKQSHTNMHPPITRDRIVTESDVIHTENVIMPLLWGDGEDGGAKITNYDLHRRISEVSPLIDSILNQKIDEQKDVNFFAQVIGKRLSISMILEQGLYLERPDGSMNTFLDILKLADSVSFMGIGEDDTRVMLGFDF